MIERFARPTRRADRPAAESGQVLVVFALALVAMLAMAGLLVDGGRAWADERLAQNAADMASLAAARALALGNDGVAAANTVAATNGFPSGSITCPGKPTMQGVEIYTPPVKTLEAKFKTNKYVEVVVTRKMATTFSALVGQNCWRVSAHSVSRTEPTVPSGPGLLAMSPSDGCGNGSTMKLGGANIIINGDVISNGGIDWTGGGGAINGSMTYRGTAAVPPLSPAVCIYKDHGHPAATPVSTVYVNPFTYTTADFHCTNGPPLPAKLELPPTGTLITDGTYCASDSVTIKTAGATCNACTFIAPKIQISAANVYLRPREHNVLMWGTGTGDAINWSGSGGDWAGIVYAPNGDAHISGGAGLTISGAVWAKTIEIPGGDFTLSPPLGAVGDPGVVKLVE